MRRTILDALNRRLGRTKTPGDVVVGNGHVRLIIRGPGEGAGDGKLAGLELALELSKQALERLQLVLGRKL
jgi:hypothetical protein